MQNLLESKIHIIVFPLPTIIHVFLNYVHFFYLTMVNINYTCIPILLQCMSFGSGETIMQRNMIRRRFNYRPVFMHER